MKKLLTLLLNIPILLFAQEKFSLNGSISKANDSKKIYLIHLEDNGEKIDSTVVNNGKFEFNIDLNSPTIAILLLDHSGKSLAEPGAKDIYRFFIETGKATLQTTDSISKAQVSGLNIFKELATFEQAINPVNENIEKLNLEFSTLKDSEKAKQEVLLQFQQRYLELVEKRRNAVKDFVAKHPASFISLYHLNSELAHDEMNVPEIQALYNALPQKFQDHLIGKTIHQKLEQGKITGIGVLATDFEETTPEGIAVKLSSYKGQYVLVDFWASWCGPCRQENPHLVNAYEKFKDKGFTILGVSIDQSADAWKKAIKADGLLWAQLLDTTQQIAMLYGIDAIPRNYLLDKEGRIIAKNLRGLALEEKLSEILK